MSEKAVASSALLGLFSNDITLAFTLLFCARMMGNSVSSRSKRGEKIHGDLLSAILGKGMRLQDGARFRCTSVLAGTCLRGYICIY